ncbi:PilX N-terminal domain-containing pilus assembly protein [Rhodoferax sp.]|uniref:pilus assembly PilX family protein n=1 Tax=Rhodoferax sp. TaxID=50421 RepID=UPI00374D432A
MTQQHNLPPAQSTMRHRNIQRGASLIVVMMVLTIVSLLGVAGIQIATMAERGARNDRDQQVAWQSAEAALVDAEFDIYGPSTSPRLATFQDSRDITGFLPGCGTSGNNIGLCALVSAGKPAWVTVDFTTTGTGAPTTAFGTYTNRTFAAGGVGVQPSKPPRYVIEPIRDPGDRDQGSANPKYIYRVTAMGFGPRDDIQAVTQMIYRD